MNISELYPYVDENQLLVPHRYMYTPFSGEIFFSAHEAVRFEFLASLCDRFEIAEPLPEHEPSLLLMSLHKEVQGAPWAKRPLAFISAFHKSVVSEACEGNFLFVALEREIQRRLEGDEPDVALVEGLLRRFEVSRKLPLFLQPPQYGLTNGHSTQVRDYAYFALLLGLVLASGPDVRALNCLLKANDLLGSQPLEHFDPQGAAIACAAICFELGAVTELTAGVSDAC